MTNESALFLNIVEKKCQKLGVTLNLKDSQFVDCYGSPCSGYFTSNGNNPELSVAVGMSEDKWLPILVHEYCHMNQWEENSPFWTNIFVEGKEACELLELYISGKQNLTKEQIDSYVLKTLMVEKDCEERVVKLIKEMNLSIDTEVYTQQANVYILMHHMVPIWKDWYKPGSSRNPEIYSLMPKHFDLDYTKLSPEFEKILEKAKK